MKIVIATIGSRGDVQPYVNLAQGLLSAGHDVRLASNPTLDSLVASHGVPFIPVGSPVDMGAEGARLLEKSFDNMWIGLMRVMQLGARLVEEAYPDTLEVCKDAALVITSDTGSGVAEAEKLTSRGSASHSNPLGCRWSTSEPRARLDAQLAG